MFGARHNHIAYSPDDTCKEQSIREYWTWLFKEHATRRSALKDAVDSNFDLGREELFDEMVREAYDDLARSDDPAIQYLLVRLSYLPRGSQPRICDAVAEVEWLNDDQTRCTVVTPAGTCLGFLDKFSDGGWGITSLEAGLVGTGEIAEATADANRYLVNRLTREASCVVNGKPSESRIRIRDHFGFRSDVSARSWNDVEADADVSTYTLEFWDTSHGLTRGDRVAIGVIWDEAAASASVLGGMVTDVVEHKVSIAGSDVWTRIDRLEEWLNRYSQD